MSSKQPEITRNEVFDILSNPRRRFVLYYLREVDSTVELNTLARAIAAWENEVDESELTDQDRKRVYVSLYQTHIPKLESVGLIEYDRDSGVVRLTDESSVVTEYLGEPGTAVPWQYLYLLLSVAAVAALALVWFDVWLFATVPLVAVGVAVTLGFLVLSVVHYASTRRTGIETPGTHPSNEE